MITAPIIRNGEIVKSHREYTIVDTRWKYVECKLTTYLSSLRVSVRWQNNVKFDRELINFVGVDGFYLRERKFLIHNLLINRDPWNRPFLVYPGISEGMDVLGLDPMYTYYVAKSEITPAEIYVLVTTVNRMRVYCIDVVT